MATQLDMLNTGVAMWPNVTARSVARNLGIAHTLILYHFSGVEAYKQAVKQHAIDTGNNAVVAQLIASNDPAVASMSQRDRRAVLSAVG